MGCVMEYEDIIKILPHRYPFLLVDRIIDLKEGEYVVGIKNVTINEHFFQGHFPGMPIMPGVLIIEAMAQVGGILAYKSTPSAIGNKLIYFMSMDKVKFRKPVRPGDQIRFHLRALRTGKKVWRMKGEAFVDDNLVAEAELTAAMRD